MIANDNDAPPHDRLDELYLTHPDMIGEGCKVTLDDQQFRVLKRYLDHVRSVGGVNFVLERCEDYRAFSDTAGYSVSWDNDGNEWQDDFIDTTMEQMTQSLGFEGGSILREGYLIELSDIDQQVKEIKARVTERSRQRMLDSILPNDTDPTFEQTAPPSPEQATTELTDIKRSWVKTAHSAGAGAEWIADRTNLPLETVNQLIGENGT